MRTAVVLLTRDLRVHDNPALAAACRRADRVVPLFVLDERLLARSPRRTALLVGALGALDRALADRGGRLVVRRGHTAAEAVAVVRAAQATELHLMADVSAWAQRRAARLRRALPGVDVVEHPGVTVVPPGLIAPPGRDHYAVFTPYHRAWEAAPWREQEPAPAEVAVPAHVAGERLPDGGSGAGELDAQAALDAFLARGLATYAHLRDDPAGGGGSRLGRFLHLGCLSPLEVAVRAGAGEFRRQLCWRDFYHQLLRARPATERHDLHPLGYAWDDDPDALRAWQEGRTGFPLVDAGMRQLAAEGHLPNRVRMVVASFLTKDLNLPWQAGAAWFDRHLLDGDVANNVGGWQWVAGTGADTRPGRMFNPTLQARRFDPHGTYIRRHVPELADVPGGAVFEPWKLPEEARGGYPPPLVDHIEATRRYRALNAAGRRARSGQGTLL